MTESTRTMELGEVIEDEIHNAEQRWAATNRGKRSIEVALGTLLTQTQVSITKLPGGRVTVYVECYGKRPGSKATYYNRFQRIPDSGYVRVYTRKM